MRSEPISSIQLSWGYGGRMGDKILDCPTLVTPGVDLFGAIEGAKKWCIPAPHRCLKTIKRAHATSKGDIEVPLHVCLERIVPMLAYPHQGGRQKPYLALGPSQIAVGI